MKRVWMRLPGSGPPLQPQIPTSSARSHHLGGKSPSSEPTHDAHLILGGLRRLKHVGAWMQTMYLCAEDSDLGVCALGGGPGDVLPRLCGADIDDPTRAVAVGEMIVAGRAE